MLVRFSSYFERRCLKDGCLNLSLLIFVFLVCLSKKSRGKGTIFWVVSHSQSILWFISLSRCIPGLFIQIKQALEDELLKRIALILINHQSFKFVSVFFQATGFLQGNRKNAYFLTLLRLSCYMLHTLHKSYIFFVFTWSRFISQAYVHFFYGGCTFKTQLSN